MIECQSCGGPVDSGGSALGGWPFEWQVASRLREENQQLRSEVLVRDLNIEALHDSLRVCHSAANSIRFAAPELMGMHVERIEKAVEEALRVQGVE